MNAKELRQFWKKCAASEAFKPIGHDCWYQMPLDNPIHLFISLEKSKWSASYNFWSRIFIQDTFGRSFDPSLGKPSWHPSVFRVEQNNAASKLFDLDYTMHDIERQEAIVRFFKTEINHLVNLCRDRLGIQRMEEQNLVLVTPPLKSELLRLGLWDIGGAN